MGCSQSLVWVTWVKVSPGCSQGFLETWVKVSLGCKRGFLGTWVKEILQCQHNMSQKEPNAWSHAALHLAQLE